MRLHVHVVEAHVLQSLVHALQDVGLGVVEDAARELQAALALHDDLVAGEAGQREGLAEPALRLPLRVAGRLVEEVHTEVDGIGQDPRGLILRQRRHVHQIAKGDVPIASAAHNPQRDSAERSGSSYALTVPRPATQRCRCTRRPRCQRSARSRRALPQCAVESAGKNPGRIGPTVLRTEGAVPLPPITPSTKNAVILDPRDPDP